MEINGSGGSFYANYKTGMDYAVAVAGKAKSFAQQQGAAALTLIDSASRVNQSSGAEALGARSFGSKIDVIG